MIYENPDVVAHNHGSIWLLQAVSPAAKEWVGEHLPEDAPMLGANYAVEWRFVDAILEGMEADGLVVAAVGRE